MLHWYVSMSARRPRAVQSVFQEYEGRESVHFCGSRVDSLARSSQVLFALGYPGLTLTISPLLPRYVPLGLPICARRRWWWWSRGNQVTVAGGGVGSRCPNVHMLCRRFQDGMSRYRHGVAARSAQDARRTTRDRDISTALAHVPSQRTLHSVQ